MYTVINNYQIIADKNIMVIAVLKENSQLVNETAFRKRLTALANNVVWPGQLI